MAKRKSLRKRIRDRYPEDFRSAVKMLCQGISPMKMHTKELLNRILEKLSGASIEVNDVKIISVIAPRIEDRAGDRGDSYDQLTFFWKENSRGRRTTLYRKELSLLIS